MTELRQIHWRVLYYAQIRGNRVFRGVPYFPTDLPARACRHMTDIAGPYRLANNPRKPTGSVLNKCGDCLIILYQLLSDLWTARLTRRYRRGHSTAATQDAGSHERDHGHAEVRSHIDWDYLFSTDGGQSGAQCPPAAVNQRCVTTARLRDLTPQSSLLQSWLSHTVRMDFCF